MSAPTPDYGEPWEISGDTEAEEWIAATNWTNDAGDIICSPPVDAEISVGHWKARSERIVACVNALAGVQDPAAHLANLNATIERWETELSAAMPPDFKDWFQNDKSEWPMVARQVIESLREREAFCMRVIEHCEDTIKTMNNALKEAHRVLSHDYWNMVRKCPDFAEVAELVRKSHDQHA